METLVFFPSYSIVIINSIIKHRVNTDMYMSLLQIELVVKIQNYGDHMLNILTQSM